MLPLLEGDSHLTIKGDLESAAYVDMTTDVLSRFGIRIRKTDDGFDIPGSQRYEYKEEDDEIVAEGDWSNGAYLMTIGTLGCGRVFDCSSHNHQLFDPLRLLCHTVCESIILTVVKGDQKQ